MIALCSAILRATHTLPTGGGYRWPVANDPGASGTTRDLHHRGDRFLRSNGATFCSGITFEAWWSVVADLSAIRALSLTEIRALQRDWYVAGSGRRGPVDALVPRGLGVVVADPRRAMPGDLAQLWRSNGTGHTVVLLHCDGERVAYWSSQRATDGVGVHVEAMPRELHIVRPVVAEGIA